jgi:hypothetical protein
VARERRWRADSAGRVTPGANGLPRVRSDRARPRPPGGAPGRRAGVRGPVRAIWAKRRWRCPEPACPIGSFTEQDERVAAPRAKVTTRARSCPVVGDRADAKGACLGQRDPPPARDQLGPRVGPRSAASRRAAADESRFENVTILGVYEHIWHHVSTKPIEVRRGPKELTGMVALHNRGCGLR